MRPRLVALVGPTAAGKTSASLELARLGLEVVNADSRQIYRGMDIGTAKPTFTERASLPHHLFDIADPADTYSLALYKRAAQAAIATIGEHGSIPLLVGGTGQYVWALLEDWKVPEVAPDPAYRNECTELARSQGAAALHQQLAEVDPIAAGRIEPNNVRRVSRALEVFHATGIPISTWQEKGEPSFDYLLLGLDLPKEQIHARIDQRVEEMFAARFVEEVEQLLAAGLAQDAPSLTSIGYRQIVSLLAGDLTLAAAIEETKRATRQLARKQMQWFRRTDPRITWSEDPLTFAPTVATFLRR